MWSALVYSRTLVTALPLSIYLTLALLDHQLIALMSNPSSNGCFCGKAVSVQVHATVGDDRELRQGVNAPQVLAEQCRRLGVDIEAGSSQTAAVALASNGMSTSRKKPGWNLDISSIHRRIKDDMRSGSIRLQAPGHPSESPEQLPLPPGWEASRCKP